MALYVCSTVLTVTLPLFTLDQLEADIGCGGDNERTASDAAKNRVETATESLVETAEVPPVQCSAGRSDRTSRRKPRSNVDGTPETAHELDRAVIAQSKRRQQSNDDKLADAGGIRTAELTDDSSGDASQDGCTDLAHTTPPKLSPGETFFVSPFSEIDKMKDREERFGQPKKTNHPSCSEPSCSGNDVHDGGRGGCNRVGEEPRSEAAILKVAGTTTANDAWKEKLLKRKARFGAPPLDRSRMKMASEPMREVPRPAPSETATKMARRMERFRATPSGPCSRLVSGL